MIGQTVQAPRPFPLGAVFWFLAAAGLVALAAAQQNVHWAVAALLPLLLAWAFLKTRPPALRLRFTDQGLEVEDPPQLIPYQAIEGLRTRLNPVNPAFLSAGPDPIYVVHADGVLCIPPRPGVSAAEVFRFLYERFSAGGSRDVNPVLGDYLQKQEAAFGPERVWSYRARKHLRFRKSSRPWAVCLAFVVTGLIWLAVGVVQPQPGWTGAGTALAAIGLIVAFYAWLALKLGPRQLRRLHKASLVISPPGLALVQGDLQGEMRWEELRDVKLETKRGAFESSSVEHAVVLTVEGAQIRIEDIYDRPLPMILERLRQYWR